MRSDRGTLHVISGRLAAGKTTLARQLAEREGAVFLCEDVWLSRLSDGIVTFEDYLKWSRRCRGVMGPLIVGMLRNGCSVVLDFAGNTARERRWVRTLFEEANAPHVLHVLEASEAVCLQRLALRNETKPEGLYFAATSEEQFWEIMRWFEAPRVDEGFHLVVHPAE